MKIYKQLLVETETISEHDLLPLFEEIGLDTKTYTVSYLAEMKHLHLKKKQDQQNFHSNFYTIDTRTQITGTLLYGV